LSLDCSPITISSACHAGPRPMSHSGMAHGFRRDASGLQCSCGRVPETLVEIVDDLLGFVQPAHAVLFFYAQTGRMQTSKLRQQIVPVHLTLAYIAILDVEVQAVQRLTRFQAVRTALVIVEAQAFQLACKQLALLFA